VWRGEDRVREGQRRDHVSQDPTNGCHGAPSSELIRFVRLIHLSGWLTEQVVGTLHSPHSKVPQAQAAAVPRVSKEARYIGG
jgi:hypothetical protein